MKLKKVLCALTAIISTVGLITACGSDTGPFNLDKYVSVISREEGSGTRGAFVELLGVEQKDSNGKKVDYTTDEAMITNNTAVMMTSVSSDRYAVGYISLGSLNDTVQPAKIDGVLPTSENIINGSYKISRPFNIATKGAVSGLAEDYINFILSSEGQKTVQETGYIPSPDTRSYSGKKLSGKLVVAGSSSVTPVMEKLKEEYMKVNPNAQIEIQESDSTTGMVSAMNGICDIGMASRDLSESEKASGLVSTRIATDGIVIILNKDNPFSDLSTEQVRDIFTGKVENWSQITDRTAE